MTLLDKEGVKKAKKSLKEFDPNQNIIILNSSARTALEAAESLNCDKGAIVKSLLFKTENAFILCLIAGDKKASLNKIKKELNIKDCSMATDEEVKDVTGYTIGGVSPLGHLNKIDIYVDNSLKRFNLPPEVTEQWWASKRAEQLTWQEFVELTNWVEKNEL